MAGDLDEEFAKDQKVLVKRAMKGRPLYFGLQAKAAKSGKLVLSKRPGEVKPTAVKDMAPYQGKDAEKKNVIPGGVSNGVATGENGLLTLHFERGKALPVAASFVKYFITRELKIKCVKKVVIAEADQLPVVPEKMDGDDVLETPESIQLRAQALLLRVRALGGDQSRLETMIQTAVEGTAKNVSASDDLLDDVEFTLATFDRLISLERILADTESQPGVAAEVVASIRTKRLLVARQQLDTGKSDEADDNLDLAEQSIANVRLTAGASPARGEPSTESRQDNLDETRSEWDRRFALLQPDLIEVLKGTSKDTETIRKIVQLTREQRQSDPGKALQSLTSLEESLQSALSTLDTSGLASEWAEKQRLITPDLKRCLKEQLGDTEKIRAVFGWAQEKADAGDYPKAITAIDNLSVLLKEAIRAATEESSGLSTTNETAIPPKAELSKRLLEIRDGAALAGAGEDFQEDIRAAAQAIQASDPGVVDLLDELELRLASVAGKKRVAEAENTIQASAISSKVGVVEFARLRLKLKAAQSSRATAASNLQAACFSVLSSPDFVDDPRASAPETLTAISKIGERVPPITDVVEDVDKALDDMAKTTDPAERERAKKAALKSLSEYRRRLDDVPLLKDMQSTEAGTFVIYDGIAAAVDELIIAIRA